MVKSRRTIFISLITGFIMLVSACTPGSKGVDQEAMETPNDSESDLDMEVTQAPTQPGSMDEVDADFPRPPDPISISVTLDTPNMVSTSSYDFMFIMETTNADNVEYYLSVDNKLYNQEPDGSLVTAFGTEVTMTPISAIENLPFSQGFLAAVQFGPDGIIMSVPARVSLTVPGNHEKDYIGFTADGSGGDFHLYPMNSSYADYNDTTSFSFDMTYFSIYGVANVMPGEVEAQQAHAPASPASQDEDDLAPLITVKLPYDELGPVLAEQQLQLEKSHSRLVKPLIDDLANTDCAQVASTAYAFSQWYSKVDMFFYHTEYFQAQIDSDANAIHDRFIECVKPQCEICSNPNSTEKVDLATIDPIMVLVTFAETLSFNTGLDDFSWWSALSTECANRAGIKSPAGSTGGDYSGEGPAPTQVPFSCSPN